MQINWNLLPALLNLRKENSGSAETLVNRIEKKEVRIIADFAMAITSIDHESDPRLR